MVVVTISGPAGAGKSTVGKQLASRLGIGYYSIGSYFREKAAEAGKDVKEFTEQVGKEFHLQADAHVDALSKKGNVVLDGRLTGYMASHADFRIYLTAPLDVRARRNAEREGLGFEEARKRVTEREEDHMRIFKEIYGLDTEDLSIYDLVLNTEHLDVNEVVLLVEKVVRLALKL